MKKLLDPHKELNEKNWKDMEEAITEYNAYIEIHLKQIFEFDVWYEHSKNIDFPKDWYSMIRDTKSHK
jgi:hypothetical protein